MAAYDIGRHAFITMKGLCYRKQQLPPDALSILHLHVAVNKLLLFQDVFFLIEIVHDLDNAGSPGNVIYSYSRIPAYHEDFIVLHFVCNLSCNI